MEEVDMKGPGYVFSIDYRWAAKAQRAGVAMVESLEPYGIFTTFYGGRSSTAVRLESAELDRGGTI
jgi:hypothetical protein